MRQKSSSSQSENVGEKREYVSRREEKNRNRDTFRDENAAPAS